MTERGLALARVVQITPASPNSEYFSRLTLRDVYGDYTLKPGTRIITDVPNDDNAYKLFKDHERLAELAKKHNIPSIGSGSYGGDRKKQPFIEISAGMGSPTAVWAPYVYERGAITALARAVTRSEKPFLLDVGCGNGFTSKLLAADNGLKVFGIDPYLPEEEELPATPGDIALRKADIFDVIDELGPIRSPQNLERIISILTKIRDSFKDKGEMYFWGMQHGFRTGYGDSDKEVKDLQELGGKYSTESPVDVVLCSFMATGTDLTLAIRDGLRPKAIVYAKPMNGLSGVGDYYTDSERYKSGYLDNKVVSFNPGKNYKTLVRWQTFWADDWGREVYDQTVATEPTEVVVQVRKGVKLKLPQNVTMRGYQWDQEIEDVIVRQVEKHRRYEERYHPEYKWPMDFFLGLGAKPASLTGGTTKQIRS